MFSFIILLCRRIVRKWVWQAQRYSKVLPCTFFLYQIDGKCLGKLKKFHSLQAATLSRVVLRDQTFDTQSNAQAHVARLCRINSSVFSCNKVRLNFISFFCR